MNNELAALERKQVKLSSLNRGDLITSGGFADIYRAYGSKGPVVLRILKKGQKFSSKQRQQFINGFDIRRKCGNHPNIVKYYGEDTPLMGQPFEVIELVEGKSLKSAVFEKNQIIHNKPVDVLRQCAAAMMHIHQIGYLHLDIKPENYLVSSQPNRVELKLTDFDLCLPLDAKVAPPGYGGSMMYLAPEFLKNKEISVGSDIFAFGVMAFYVCTRQMPFVGSVASIMNGSNYEIRFPASFGNTLSPRVQDLIIKCLSKNPKDRFKDGAELFFSLESISIEETKEVQLAQLRKQFGKA